MSKYKIKSTTPELFKVVDKGNTGLEANKKISSYGTDLLPTTKDGSFANLRLYRLKDYELDEVSILGKDEFEKTNHYEGYTLDISTLSIKLTFTSESYQGSTSSEVVDWSDPDVEKYLVYLDSSGKEREDTKDFIVKSNTVKLRVYYTYNDVRLYDDIQVAHTKKIQPILTLNEWDVTQITDSPVDFTGLKFNVFYDPSGQEIIDYNNLDNRFKFNTPSIVKWKDNTNKQSITFTGVFNENSTSFNDQPIEITIDKTLIYKCISKIEIVSGSFTGMQFFNTAPTFDFNFKVTYNNNDSKEIDYSKVTTTPEVWPSYSGYERYLDSPMSFNYTEKDKGKVSHTVTVINKSIIYRKLLSLSIDKTQLPIQYEHNALDLTNVNYVATYNNEDKVVNKLSYLSYSVTSKPELTYDKVHNRWVFADSVKEEQLDTSITFSYRDNTSQYQLLTLPVTVKRKQITLVNVTDTHLYDDKQVTNFTPSFNSLQFTINYNNGEYELKNPSVGYSNVSLFSTKLNDFIGRWPSLETLDKDKTIDWGSSESLDKYVKVDSKFYYMKNYQAYSGTEPCVLTVNVFRKPETIVAHNFDDTDYHFYDENQYIGSEVKLEKLKEVIITFNDNSKVTLDLSIFTTTEEKRTFLKNHYVTLYKNTWGYELSGQINYFKFKVNSIRHPYDFDEIQTVEDSIEFKKKILELVDVVQLTNRELFQGEAVNLGCFVYSLKYIDEQGQEQTARSINIDKIEGDYGIITKYNSKIKCTNNDGQILKNWPTPTTPQDPSVTYAYNTNFTCESLDGSFESKILRDVPVILSRVLQYFGINNASSTEIIGPYYFGDSVKEVEDADKYYEKIYKLTFTNKYTYIGKLSLNELHTDTEYWSWKDEDPSKSYFNVYYKQNSTVREEFPVTFTCNNMRSKLNVKSFKVTQKNFNIKSGEEFKTNDFNYTLTNTVNKQIPVDLSKVTISPPKSEPIETYKENVNFTYLHEYKDKPYYSETVSANTDVSLKLASYTVTITHDDGVSYTSLKTFNYPPKNEVQKIPLTIQLQEDWSYKGYVIKDNLGKTLSIDVTYDFENKKIIIGAGVSGSFVIAFTTTQNGASDEFGNRYFYDNSTGILTKIKCGSNNNGKYHVVNGIKIIPKSESCFYKNINVKEIEFPTTLIRINDEAFVSCSNLLSAKFNNYTGFTIGRSAFKNCSQLSTLDFLNCGKMTNSPFYFGTPDSAPNNNKQTAMNVWTGCVLRVIKIQKSNFGKVCRIYCLPNSKGYAQGWVTGRIGGDYTVKFRVAMGVSGDSDRECYVRSIGLNRSSFDTSGKFKFDNWHSGSFTLSSYSKNSWYAYVYDYQDTTLWIAWDSQHYSGSKPMSGSYDHSVTCALTARSDGSSDLVVVCYGMNHFTQNVYDTQIRDKAKYRFTTNGRVGVEFVSDQNEKVIGTDFSNWDMKDNVNACVYPNVSLGTELTEANAQNAIDNYSTSYNTRLSGTYLDFMIPIYN